MGGSGKTTLAKHIYYSNKHDFEGSSLLEEIEKQPGGLLGVQKKLLRNISGNKNMMISNVYEGALQLEKAIQMNKVLIIVDDVDDKDKLSTLFGTKVFPTQSRIIVTTKLQNIDTWYGTISCGCLIHQIELLNDPESLELLSFHAFGSKFPMKGLEGLALQLAQYCEGIH
ncbi:TMV resistance protein N-like [Bidens hawaiensis]|uniref:TMV resistance protein N-like n=1 Tax=Bidens hawaiensis TaxID=980011 RepID=UPI004049D2EE